MTPTDSELQAMWLSVIDEYHTTPLAADFRYQPTRAKFLELRTVIDHLPAGGTLLDIGVGMAVIARVARRLGARVISVDPPFTGPAARTNAELAGIETLVCDVTTTPLPLPDASIDCILFADVIEHFTNSPRPALAEFHRVLKPGGVCIATTPNAVRLPVRLKLLMGYSNWPPVADYFDEPVHAGHHHEYTPEEFRAAFERCGFSTAELKLHGSTGDVETIGFDRLAGAGKAATGGNPLVGLGKRGIGLIEKLSPRLRRDMLLVARA
jgi:SAM-dependent methyltransferase